MLFGLLFGVEQIAYSGLVGLFFFFLLLETAAAGKQINERNENGPKH